MALIIGERLATLYELETVYSFNDALNMAEALIIRNHNEKVALNKRKNG